MQACLHCEGYHAANHQPVHQYHRPCWCPRQVRPLHGSAIAEWANCPQRLVQHSGAAHQHVRLGCAFVNVNMPHGMPRVHCATWHTLCDRLNQTCVPESITGILRLLYSSVNSAGLSDAAERRSIVHRAGLMSLCSRLTEPVEDEVLTPFGSVLS